MSAASNALRLQTTWQKNRFHIFPLRSLFLSLSWIQQSDSWGRPKPSPRKRSTRHVFNSFNNSLQSFQSLSLIFPLFYIYFLPLSSLSWLGALLLSPSSLLTQHDSTGCQSLLLLIWVNPSVQAAAWLTYIFTDSCESKLELQINTPMCAFVTFPFFYQDVLKIVILVWI